MTDTTPPPRSNDPANDGYELRNAEDARRERGGRSITDEIREAVRDVGEKVRHAGQRISDAVEDAIPGDSDSDGH